jgi:hypothetical protein
MMSVAVEAGAAFNFKPAARLFESTCTREQQPPSYGVAGDGRFVMIKPGSSGKIPSPRVPGDSCRRRATAGQLPAAKSEKINRYSCFCAS